MCLALFSGVLIVLFLKLRSNLINDMVLWVGESFYLENILIQFHLFRTCFIINILLSKLSEKSIDWCLAMHFLHCTQRACILLYYSSPLSLTTTYCDICTCTLSWYLFVEVVLIGHMLLDILFKHTHIKMYFT